jgi:hypothetical protein
MTYGALETKAGGKGRVQTRGRSGLACQPIEARSNSVKCQLLCLKFCFSNRSTARRICDWKLLLSAAGENEEGERILLAFVLSN